MQQLTQFKDTLQTNADCLADPAAAAEHQRNVRELQALMSRQEARCARIRSAALRLLPLFVVALAVWWHSESLVI